MFKKKQRKLSDKDKKTINPRFDIAIIGAGQTGLTVAKHLVKREFNVLIIDKQEPGIKTSLDLKNFNKLAKRFSKQKMTPEDFFQTLSQRLNHINKEQNSELLSNLSNNSYFNFVKGEPKEIDEYSLIIDDKTYEFKKLVFATGSYFKEPEYSNLKREMYLNLDEIKNLNKFYKTIAIYGTDIEALELAYSFTLFGSDVYLFDENVNPFNDFDDDLEAILKTSFRPNNINWCLEAQIVNHIFVSDRLIRIEYFSQDSKKFVEVEKIFVTGNKVSETRNLNSKYDIPLNAKGSIIIDNSFKVKENPNYFAVGDVNGMQMHPSQANWQAITLSKYLGRELNSKFGLYNVSFTIDIDPQISFFGANKHELDDLNQPYNEFIFDFDYELNSKLLSHKSRLKVYTNNKHEILGVFLYGNKIKELLPLFVMASVNKIKFYKLSTLNFPFYSKSEAIRDAALEYELEFVGLSKKLQKIKQKEERKEY